MSYISADKFYSPILKKIATGDVSVFLDASNVELKVAESYRNVKWRPLYLACNNGHLNVLNRLLEIPEVIVNATSLECYALRMAAENGHLNIVNRLLEIPQVLANAAAHDNYGLRASAHLGHLNVVRRLLEIPVVVVNAATGNHASLRMSSDNGYNEIAYIMAKIQWPRGAIDMPSYLHQYLPAIYQGAKIASGRQEFEGIVKCWIRGTSASNTNDIHYPSHDKPSQNLIRIDKYNAPRAIMQYAVCSMQYAVCSMQDVAMWLQKL